MNKKVVTVSVIVILSIVVVVLLNIFFSPSSGDGEASAQMAEELDHSVVESAFAAETGHGHETEAEHGHEAEPAAHMEVEAEHGHKAEPAAHVETEAEHGHEAEPAANVEVEAEHGHEAEPVAHMETEAEHGHEVEPAAHVETEAEHGHEAEPVAHMETEAEHRHEVEPAAHVETEAEHGHEAEPALLEAEAEGGHGHSDESGIGYIGLDTIAPVGEHELNAFVERVKEEAYIKADLDEARFIIFGLLFVLVFISFAKVKGVSKRLSMAIDWYTMGTVTGLILLILVIPSGIIITLFYMPTSTGVYDSVNDMASNGFLAFWRNMHNWSSEIFVILMLIHAARTISTNTYMGKRKFIWLTGGILFAVGFLAFLSGSFMRGDQEALEGFEHMMFAFNSIPLGYYVSNFFSGEFTLMKLTAIHVGATTFAIIVIGAVHVLMRKVYVHVERRWKTALIYTAVLTAFLVVQSFLMEAPLIRGLEAGPTVSGMEITKPPWPIYFMIGAENIFGASAMVYSTLVFIPLIVFPYVLEWLPLSRLKKLEVGEPFYYGGIFLLIALSYWAAAGEIVPHIFH